MKHVEAVIVDSGGRHRVVAQVEGLAELHYEPLIQESITVMTLEAIMLLLLSWYSSKEDKESLLALLKTSF